MNTQARFSLGKIKSKNSNAIRKLKTIMIVVIIISGMATLSGFIISGLMDTQYTVICGCVFAISFLTYAISNLINTRREERLYHKALETRKRKFATFQAQGFSPTFKSIGSSRLFAVDENLGKWVLMDYYNGLDESRLHDLSEITEYHTGKNKDYISQNHSILLFNGVRLNQKDADEYYDREGVVLRLNSKEHDHQFINCFKTEKDTEIIIKYLDSILHRKEGADKL